MLIYKYLNCVNRLLCMQEYDIDNFGWPHKKIKSQHPELLYNKEILLQLSII